MGVLGDIRETVLTVGIENQTSDLYIAVQSGYDKSTKMLAPGESSWDWGSFWSIDGFAAYRLENGVYQSVSVKDGRGVFSTLWKISNAFDRHVLALTSNGSSYSFNAWGVAWEELDTGAQNYFRGLYRYRHTRG